MVILSGVMVKMPPALPRQAVGVVCFAAFAVMRSPSSPDSQSG